jgi:hypothetical protein
VDYVYLILLGINNFMLNREVNLNRSRQSQLSSQQRRDDRMHVKERRIGIVKGQMQTKVLFTSIHFDDIELWNVAKRYEEDPTLLTSQKFLVKEANIFDASSSERMSTVQAHS